MACRAPPSALGGRHVKAQHIALVSPGHLATNPRLVKEAYALCASGYRVTTITGDFLAWARQADLEFESAPWTQVRVPFGRDAGRARWLAQTAMREMGRIAVQRLISLLGDPAQPPGRVVMETELVVRHTTAPPPSADGRSAAPTPAAIGAVPASAASAHEGAPGR